jgi:PEP-CTERM motif
MTNQGTMTGEGGGNGVSDFVELDSFLSTAGATVGFRATFQSDPDSASEMGISPPPGNFPTDVTNLLENGSLQLLTPANFQVTLPGATAPVALAVSAQSDAVETPAVPEPSTLALLSAGLLGFGMIRRRRTKR